MSKARAFSEDQFQKDVLESDQPVLVDFWAQWCPPCIALGPVIDELAEQYDGKVKVGKVNVDENQNLSAKLQVGSIPAVLIFNKGEIVQTMVGANRKSEYEKVLDQIIA